MKTSIHDTYSDYSRLRIENLRRTLRELETCHFIDPQDPILLNLRQDFLLKIAELESDMNTDHSANESRGVAPLKITLAIK